MNKPSAAISKQFDELCAVLGEFGVTKADVLSSIARGGDTDDLDIDLIVTVAGEPHGIYFYGLISDVQNTVQATSGF